MLCHVFPPSGSFPVETRAFSTLGTQLFSIAISRDLARVGVGPTPLPRPEPPLLLFAACLTETRSPWGVSSSEKLPSRARGHRRARPRLGPDSWTWGATRWLVAQARAIRHGMHTTDGGSCAATRPYPHPHGQLSQAPCSLCHPSLPSREVTQCLLPCAHPFYHPSRSAAGHPGGLAPLALEPR